MSGASASALVAFDTSGAVLITAASRDAAAASPATSLGVEDGRAGQASARLLPALRERLAALSMDWPAVQAIAFGQGPGAFTGLRTACAVAQGLALGLDVPLLPLDMLQIRAEDAHGAGLGRDGPGWWVAIDARMDEVYAAHYARRSRDGSLVEWEVVAPPMLTTPDDLAARLLAAPAQVLIGDGMALLPLAAQAAPALVDLPRCPQWHDPAAALLRSARRAWRQGNGIAPEQAHPIYLRDRVALTTAQRQALREASA